MQYFGLSFLSCDVWMYYFYVNEQTDCTHIYWVPKLAKYDVRH